MLQQQQISVNRFPISELRNRKEQLRLQRERLLQEITLTEKLDKTRQELRKRQDKLQQQQQNLQATQSSPDRIQKRNRNCRNKIHDHTPHFGTSPTIGFRKCRSTPGPTGRKYPLPGMWRQSHPYAAHHPLADGLLETLEKEVRQHEAAYNRLKTENAAS